MKSLTKLQSKLLTHLKKSTKEKGFQPSIQEMADHFGITATAIIQKLKIIEKQKYIKITGKSRAIEFKEKIV